MSLRDEFKDREYRRFYAESFANTIIATQNRLLRGKLTQKEFAALVGIKQSRVSAMEDENYSAWSTKTLKRLAAAKDVVFVGRYISFADLLEWSKDMMSEESLTVVPFEQDAAFHIESLFAKARADRRQAMARIDNGDQLTLTEQSKELPVGKVLTFTAPSRSIEDATNSAVAV